VFGRHSSRGIFISATDYTEASIAECTVALSRAVVVLCSVREFVRLLEREGDLKEFLKTKIRAAVINKRPWHPCEE
jgi:hypothetical protein